MDLEPTQNSIRGALFDDNAAPKQFHGWLELSELLEEIRPRPPVVADDPGPNERRVD